MPTSKAAAALVVGIDNRRARHRDLRLCIGNGTSSGVGSPGIRRCAGTRTQALRATKYKSVLVDLTPRRRNGYARPRSSIVVLLS